MANDPVTQPSRSSPDQPLGDLDTNQYTYANFIYPLDLGTSGAGNDHYMVFHINETDNTQFNTRTVNGSAPTDQPTINNPSGGPVGPDGNPVNVDPVTNLSQPIHRVATTIVLYIPESVTTEYHAEWDAVQLGSAAAISDRIFGNTSWTDVFKSIGASGIKNAGQMLNEITGLSLSDAASLSTHFAINPHQEVIFNGIGFRTFNFKYRFTPTSEEEAINVDNIIRAFKFYAAPEIKTGTAGRFWIYPAEFDIQYYSNGQENLFLNKISTCALSDIQINYTGMGHWSAFRPYNGGGNVTGNPPVCSEISLTFKELEIMTKRRSLQGY